MRLLTIVILLLSFGQTASGQQRPAWCGAAGLLPAQQLACANLPQETVYLDRLAARASKLGLNLGSEQWGASLKSCGSNLECVTRRVNERIDTLLARLHTYGGTASYHLSLRQELRSTPYRFHPPERGIPIPSTSPVVIEGYTLEDKEIWLAALLPDGSYRFYGTTGRVSTGQIIKRGNGVCFISSRGTRSCRYPAQIDNRIYWRDHDSNTITSEILSVRVRSDLSTSPPQNYTQTNPKQRPGACTDTLMFCSELAVKAAICGWVAHKGVDQAIGDSTGAAGSAIAGASCTALASAADGLSTDALDILIAAIGSAALTQAEEDLSEGNYRDARDGLIGGGIMTAIGIAKCNNSLSQICR